jgi:hypothetical protein
MTGTGKGRGTTDAGERLRSMIQRRAGTPERVAMSSDDLIRWRLENVEAAVAAVHREVRRLYWLVIGAVVVQMVARWFGG